MADKSDPNNPGPFKGTFSFVNKDAGNLSSKEHSAAVLWHVQHRYERWKKQQLARRMRATSSVPTPGSFSGTSQSEATGEGDATQLNLPPFEIPAWTGMPKYMQQTETSSIATSHSTGSGYNTPAISDAGAPGTYGQSQAAQISRNIVEEPAPGTPIINNLMAFAYQVLIPSAWPNEGAANPPSYELTRSWDDLSFTAEDMCYANALFSVIAGAMATTTGNDALIEHAQTFQAKAMVALRNRIQTQQDLRNPTTFRAILHLFTSETLVGNAAAARVHLKMLRHLIIEAGGVITLDSWFKENVVCCDAYFAIRYETRPHFSATEWTPGPLNIAWKGHIAAAARSPSSDDASEVDATVEHRVLRDVISDLRELLAVHDYITTHTVPPDEPLLRWRQLRRFDCISRLADHQVNCTLFPHLYVDPVVHLTLCTAILLWAGLVFGSPEPVRLGSKLFSDLRKRLERWTARDEEDSALRSTYANLELWVLNLGVQAAETLPDLRADKEWFRTTFQSRRDVMGLANSAAVTPLLRGFLFSDRLQAELDRGIRHRDVNVRQGIYSVSGCSWRLPLEEGGGTPEPGREEA